MSLQAVRPGETFVDQPTQSTEVLIREARRRQRRRHLFTFGVVLIVAATGLLTFRMTKAGAPSPQARPSPHRGQVRSVFAAGPFTGSWHVHTTSVTIQSDGQGLALWPGPLTDGAAEATAPPGHAEIRVTKVSGTKAIALVFHSTELSALPDGPARLQVSSQDLLYVTPSAPTIASAFGRSGLCGSRALALTLSQQIAAGINCGA